MGISDRDEEEEESDDDGPVHLELDEDDYALVEEATNRSITRRTLRSGRRVRGERA